jgi:hypothetical protein
MEPGRRPVGRPTPRLGQDRGSRCGGDTVDISGEVKEDKIRLTFETGGYKLEYSGAVSGESMKGEIQVAGATGTFTGKRTTP